MHELDNQVMSGAQRVRASFDIDEEATKKEDHKYEHGHLSSVNLILSVSEIAIDFGKIFLLLSFRLFLNTNEILLSLNLFIKTKLLGVDAKLLLKFESALLGFVHIPLGI